MRIEKFSRGITCALIVVGCWACAETAGNLSLENDNAQLYRCSFNSAFGCPSNQSGPNAIWARSVFSGGYQATFQSTTIDNQGNIYAVGYQGGDVVYSYDSDVSTPPCSPADNGRNALIVKYNAAGKALWARKPDVCNVTSYFNAVATDAAGNVYAAGVQNGPSIMSYGGGISLNSLTGYNPILIKYDAQGNTLWGKIPSTVMCAARFYGVTIDQSGNIYVVGEEVGNSACNYGPGVISSPPANGVLHPFILKYDPSGSAQWVRSETTSNTAAQFTGVTTDSSGNVYAAGYQSSNGDTYTYGPGVSVNVAANGEAMPLLVKYTANGVTQWARYGTPVQPTNAKFTGITSYGGDSIYVVGYQGIANSFSFGNGILAGGLSSGRSALLVKYDSNGVARWARSPFDGPNASDFYSVATDTSGNPIAVGAQSGTGAFVYDPGVIAQSRIAAITNAMIVKYNSQGISQWARTVISGPSLSTFYGISINSQNQIVAAGFQHLNQPFSYSTSIAATGAILGHNSVLVRYR